MFTDNLGKAPLLHWLLHEHLPPDIMQRRKELVPGFVCCGLGPTATRAETRHEVRHFLSSRRKEAAAVGKSGSVLFLLVSLFLPEAGSFPNGLLRAQSSLAEILA